MNGIQGLSTWPCSGLPIRDEPPSVFEYVAAELWILQCFREAYTSSKPQPNIVTTQLERLFVTYEVHDDVMDLVLTLLQIDFRNTLKPSQVSRFKSLLRAGGTEAELRALLRETDTGGNLKPDMLGIYAGHPAIEFEAVEVGTVKTAQSTFDELQNKLGVIRSIIVPQLRIELPQLSLRKKMSVPTDVVVAGSAWRPSPWQRILPLPVRVSTQGRVTNVDWICYHPTMTFRSRTSPAPPSGWRGGEDGIVLYHIHRLPAQSQEVPAKVKSEVQRAIRRWQAQQGLVLTLDPAFYAAMKEERDAFGSQAKTLIAYLGVAGLLLVAVGVGWELGVVGVGAAVAEQGLAALLGTPEILLPALAGARQMTSQMWPALGPTSGLLTE